MMSLKPPLLSMESMSRAKTEDLKFGLKDKSDEGPVMNCNIDDIFYILSQL